MTTFTQYNERLMHAKWFLFDAEESQRENEKHHYHENAFESYNYASLGIETLERIDMKDADNVVTTKFKFTRHALTLVRNAMIDLNECVAVPKIVAPVIRKVRMIA